MNFGEGGGKTKNGGENPCSENYAEQKQEPTAIDHVDNPQWQMGDAGYMEESARGQKQKKEKNE